MKWAAVGCLHAPITHPGYLDWVLKTLEEYKPDIFVNLGDWFEGKAAKRWPDHPSETWDLTTEFQHVSKQAQSLNVVLGDCQKYWLHGNHDFNLFHEPHRVHKDIQPLIQGWRDSNPYGIATALEDWKIIEKYGHDVKLQLGPLTFQHGCQTGKGIPQSHLKDQAYSYCRPFGLHVSAHTHEPVAPSQCRERSVWLPYWYANTGTGADWDKMHYMDRASKQGWGRGLIVGTVCEKAIRNRKPHYATKEWSADLLVHSYFSENRHV